MPVYNTAYSAPSPLPDGVWGWSLQKILKISTILNLRNCIFQAIMEAKIWLKYIKSHTTCRGFQVIKNTGNFESLNLLTNWRGI